MPRAVWSGTISFGLVTIPVRLYPATEPKDVRFHLVDDQGARVRFRRFITDDQAERDRDDDRDAPDSVDASRPVDRAPVGEREVAFDELQRGYETDDGTVIVTPEEIEAVRPSPSREIAIEDFVDLADIDPVYYEKSYIVSPRDEAVKPYALLLRAMERAGHAGIGRFVLRTKPHLVLIRPAGDVLGLETMFFSDEVRDGRSLVPDLGAVQVASDEVELAQTLIEALRTHWDPARYEDTYRRELLERIRRKQPVETEAGQTAQPSGRQVEELLDALKASVEEAKKSKARAGKRSA